MWGTGNTHFKINMGAVRGSEISGARNNESGFVGITYLYEHMLPICDSAICRHTMAIGLPVSVVTLM